MQRWMPVVIGLAIATAIVVDGRRDTLAARHRRDAAREALRPYDDLQGQVSEFERARKRLLIEVDLIDRLKRRPACPGAILRRETAAGVGLPLSLTGAQLAEGCPPEAGTSP